MSRMTVSNQFLIDIMDKWSHLQTLANAKDDQLNQSREQWKDFKRQLDDLEQAAQQFDHLCKLEMICQS
jgi:hypothetical protein